MKITIRYIMQAFTCLIIFTYYGNSYALGDDEFDSRLIGIEGVELSTQTYIKLRPVSAINPLSKMYHSFIAQTQNTTELQEYFSHQGISASDIRDNPVITCLENLSGAKTPYLACEWLKKEDINPITHLAHKTLTAVYNAASDGHSDTSLTLYIKPSLQDSDIISMQPRLTDHQLFYIIPIMLGPIFYICESRGINLIDENRYTIKPIPLYIIHHFSVGFFGTYVYLTQPKKIIDRLIEEEDPNTMLEEVLPLITYGYALYESIYVVLHLDLEYLPHAASLITACFILDQTRNLHLLTEIMMVETSTFISCFRRTSDSFRTAYYVSFLVYRGLIFPYISLQALNSIYREGQRYANDYIVSPTLTAGFTAINILNIYWGYKIIKNILSPPNRK